LAFSDSFHILYPKVRMSESEAPEEWMQSVTRKEVNSVIYENLRFVVGMALFDAITNSMISMWDSGISNGWQCLIYWIVAIGGISTGIVGEYFVAKWGLRKKIASKGMVQALFDTMERLYDPEQKLHFEGDADFVPMIMDTAMFEFINVSVYALAISGSLGTTKAVIFTINSITSGAGIYDVNDSDDMDQGVWVIWLAFAICLGITTFVTGYFARMVTAVKDSRKVLFKRLRSQDAKDQVEKPLINGTGGDDHFVNFALDDHKEDDSTDSDDSSASSLEAAHDPNVRKRNKFSTKAEDEAYDATVIGGSQDLDDGDDGGDDGGDVGGDDGGDVGGDDRM